MALLSSISSLNANIEQGATYVCEATPVAITTRLAVKKADEEESSGETPSAEEVAESGVDIYQAEMVEQWKGTCTLAARYSYVGLTKAAALSNATALRDAYTKSVARYAIGWHIPSASQIADGAYPCYKWMSRGSAPVCGASVTPVLMEGEMWRIDVDVAVTVEGYYDTAPTQATMKALVASFVSADTNVTLAAAAPVGGSS